MTYLLIVKTGNFNYGDTPSIIEKKTYGKIKVKINDKIGYHRKTLFSLLLDKGLESIR